MSRRLPQHNSLSCLRPSIISDNWKFRKQIQASFSIQIQGLRHTAYACYFKPWTHVSEASDWRSFKHGGMTETRLGVPNFSLERIVTV